MSQNRRSQRGKGNELREDNQDMNKMLDKLKKEIKEMRNKLEEKETMLDMLANQMRKIEERQVQLEKECKRNSDLSQEFHKDLANEYKKRQEVVEELARSAGREQITTSTTAEAKIDVQITRSTILSATTSSLVEMEMDIFKLPETTSLALCISNDFHMGRGLAAQVEEKLPLAGARPDKSSIGDCIPVKNGSRYVYYMISKDKYRDKPNESALQSCITNMIAHCKANKIKNVAMNRIGCYRDQLKWTNIKKFLKEQTKDTDINISVCYLPSKQESKTRIKGITTSQELIQELPKNKAQTLANTPTIKFFGTGTTDTAISKFAAIENKRRTWLHISKVKQDVTTEDLIKYLNHKLPNSTLTVKDITPVTGTNTFKSFQVGAEIDLQKTLLSETFWPRGIAFKPFSFKKRQNQDFHLTQHNPTIS